MEKKAFFRLAIVAVALGAGVFAAAAPVRAMETRLIWSSNSGLTNQSTEALFDGRHVQAIRTARDVLRSKVHPSNHLIARHNLCLAYIALGKDDDAKPFCDLVLAAEARTRIVEQDGRLVASTEESASDATTLSAAVRANVARAQGRALAENR